MLLKTVAIMAALFCFSNSVQGLTIREASLAQEELEGGVIEGSYRKSVAKIKETPHRVPEHLQFVPKGFVYEDADDVIHVIDPPKQFEELKKIMQRQQKRQMQPLRPVALKEQRPKPKIVKTVLPVKNKGVGSTQMKPPTESDNQTQEAQNLPVEILASVRKTENYLRKYKPKLPSVKHRLKTQKLQTVVWEKQQENQQHQHDHQQRLHGIREQAINRNRRHFNIKRFKRDTLKRLPKRLEGEQLLHHLNELINNASTYLKQAESYDDEYPDADFESTTLQGEILIKTTKPPLSQNALNEDMVVKILENSVKATNVIMQQLKTQTNLTGLKEKCDFLKVTYPNHIQNLQNQIKCMQNFIKDISHSQQQEQKRYLQQLETAQKLAKKYAERYDTRKTKDLKHKPFIVAQLAKDYDDDTATPTSVNSSLIYNDVMTTIRNMLQSQTLTSIDEATAAGLTPAWQDTYSEATLAHDKSTEPVDFHNLQEYLTSLEAIVTNLPKFNHKSLNLQEIEGGLSSKYYFINPQGTIYSLPHPFQKDVPVTAPTAIFHQFPDLPIIKEYLHNGTLLPPSSKLVEIL